MKQQRLAVMFAVLAALVLFSGCTSQMKEAASQITSGIFSTEQELTEQDCLALASESQGECFNSIAWKDSNAELCIRISEDLRREECVNSLVSINGETICSQITNKNERDSCLQTAALLKLDKEICTKISGSKTKLECILLTSNQDISEETCSSFNDDSTKNVCFRQLAGDTNNYKYCNKITNNTAKSSCLNEIVPLSPELSACSLISDESEKNTCIAKAGRAAEDPSYCDKITVVKSRDFCLKDIAVDDLNKAVCAKISYGDTKNACDDAVDAATETKITGISHYSECLDLNGQTNINNCYDTYARANKNPGVCSMITSNFSKMDSCLLTLAVELNNLGSCNAMSVSTAGNPVQDDCFRQIAVKRNNLELCQSIYNETTKDNCVSAIATDLNDMEACDLIETTADKDNCIKQVAVSKGRFDYCGTISDYTKRMDCKYTIATEQKDEELCREITDKTYRSDCYELMAEELKNNKYCLKIEANISTKNNCIYDLAVDSNSSKDCELITDMDVRGKCFAQIGINKNTLDPCINLEQSTLDEIFKGKIAIRDYCYNYMAVFLGNNTFCSKIVDGNYQIVCPKN